MKTLLFAALSLSIAIGAPALALASDPATAKPSEKKPEPKKGAAPNKESTKEGAGSDAYKGGRPAGS